jgi:hypothetical protein
MKIIIKSLLIILVIISSMSCKDSIVGLNQHDFVGVWIQKKSISDTLIFERSKKLSDDLPGYFFSLDEKVVERKNAGWCGTPPITYANYEGEWKLINNSYLQINVGFWGGTTIYGLELISCSNKTLVLKRFYFEN